MGILEGLGVVWRCVVCVGCGQQVSFGNIVCRVLIMQPDWLVDLVVHGFYSRQVLSAVQQAVFHPECSCCLLKLCLFTVVSQGLRYKS